MRSKDIKRAENELRYRESSKKRLKTIISKNIRTVMIGAISDFEEGFGELWGHGLHEDQLNEDELHNRDIWNSVRDSVLDRGNQKIRGSLDELSRHKVEWERYNMNFSVKPSSGRDQLWQKKN